jgi:ER-bound oxygenase mpaB/B'/Rubber oxygenase, catalytic domain
VLLDSFHEFPFDTARALELAFFKTFASPTIAALLDSTGEFRLRGQKRYDDTDILISTFSEDGWTGERGTRALRRMNQIHGRFDIANDDFLYVLSAMALEPLRWNERFGWRRMIEAERLALFYFWCEIGRHMGIKEIPASLPELERFNLDYERTRFEATAAGARLAQAQQNVFLAWFPVVPNRVGERAIAALLDEHVAEALGLVRPTSSSARPPQARFAPGGLLIRALPARRNPRLRTSMRRRTYPGGYTIEQLGPPPAAAARSDR